MMKIITIGTIKGGVGKSTLACNLAVEAVKAQQKVLLIDADPQQSSLDFRAIRAQKELPEFQAVSILKNTLHKDVKFFQDFNLVFIDTGGRNTAVFRSAIIASDLLLIPIVPSQYDIWATAGTVEVLEEAKSFKDIKACFVINQVLANATITKEALEALQEFKIPILKTMVHARVAFKQSIPEGMGVTELKPKSKASAETAQLFQEVLNCL